MAQPLLKQRLKELSRRPGNTVCADCQAPSPTWASFNLGVFLCMECAGHHRGVGVHITQVRSITLDSWTPAMVANMERAGNLRANAAWEARLVDPRHRIGPAAAPAQREAFIRAKYVTRNWFGQPASVGPGGAGGAAPNGAIGGGQQQQQQAAASALDERERRRMERRGMRGVSPALSAQHQQQQQQPQQQQQYQPQVQQQQQQYQQPMPMQQQYQQQHQQQQRPPLNIFVQPDNQWNPHNQAGGRSQASPSESDRKVAAAAALFSGLSVSPVNAHSNHNNGFNSGFNSGHTSPSSAGFPALQQQPQPQPQQAATVSASSSSSSVSSMWGARSQSASPWVDDDEELPMVAAPAVVSPTASNHSSHAVANRAVSNNTGGDAFGLGFDLGLDDNNQNPGATGASSGAQNGGGNGDLLFSGLGLGGSGSGNGSGSDNQGGLDGSSLFDGLLSPSAAAAGVPSSSSSSSHSSHSSSAVFSSFDQQPQQHAQPQPQQSPLSAFSNTTSGSAFDFLGGDDDDVLGANDPASSNAAGAFPFSPVASSSGMTAPTTSFAQSTTLASPSTASSASSASSAAAVDLFADLDAPTPAADASSSGVVSPSNSAVAGGDPFGDILAAPNASSSQQQQLPQHEQPQQEQLSLFDSMTVSSTQTTVAAPTQTMPLPVDTGLGMGMDLGMTTGMGMDLGLGVGVGTDGLGLEAGIEGIDGIEGIEGMDDLLLAAGNIELNMAIPYDPSLVVLDTATTGLPDPATGTNSFGLDLGDVVGVTAEPEAAGLGLGLDLDNTKPTSVAGAVTSSSSSSSPSSSYGYGGILGNGGDDEDDEEDGVVGAVDDVGGDNNSSAFDFLS